MKGPETHPYQLRQQFILENENLDFLDKALIYDSESWLVDNILVKSDRASMLNSLEIRSPFLDYRIAEFMAGVATSQKFGWFENKQLLDKALVRSGCVLPRKRKKGFNALHRW